MSKEAQIEFLREQFAASGLKFPGLRHIRVEWPEDEDFPKLPPSLECRLAEFNDEPEQPRWTQTLPVWGDAPGYRFRKGYCCQHFVRRDFGELTSRSERSESHKIEERGAWSRFHVLANKALALEAVQEFAEKYENCRVDSRWLLILHDVLKPPSLFPEASYDVYVIDDVYLSSAEVLVALPKTRTYGPVVPDMFIYGGKEYSIARPLSWRLLDYLWSQPRWTADFADLAKPVWQDHALIIDQSTFGSVRRDLNRLFDEHQLPFTISSRGQRAILKKNVE